MPALHNVVVYILPYCTVSMLRSLRLVNNAVNTKIRSLHISVMMLRRANFRCRYWRNFELLSFAIFCCGAMQVYFDMCSWQANPDDLAAEYILSKLDINPYHILMAIRGEAMAMFVAALKYYPDVLVNCKPTQLENLAIAVVKESREAHTDSIFRVLMLKIGVNEIRTGENFAYEAYLLGAEMRNKPNSVMRVIKSLPGFSELKNTSLYEETMVWGNAFLYEKSKVADLVVFCGMCLRAHFNDQMAEHVIAKLIQVMAHAVSLGERHVRHIRMVINKHRIASWDDLLVGVEAMVVKGNVLDARTIAATR